MRSGIADLRMEDVVVEFCSVPRLEFELRMVPPERLRLQIVNDLSFIPDSTALRAVWVFPGEYLPSLCAALQNRPG